MNKEHEWIYDYLFQFLKSPGWKVPILDFIDDFCEHFEDLEENKLIYTEIHSKFKSLIDDLLDSICINIGITYEDFFLVCASGVKSQTHYKTFLQILACDNFFSFKRLMIKRNKQLEAETLRTLPKLKRRILLEKKLSEEDEMEKALQKSIEDAKKIEKIKEIENRELERAIRISEEEYRRELDLEKRAKRKGTEYLERRKGKEQEIQENFLKMAQRAEGTEKKKISLGDNEEFRKELRKENIRKKIEENERVSSEKLLIEEEKIKKKEEEERENREEIGRVYEEEQEKLRKILEDKRKAEEKEKIEEEKRENDERVREEQSRMKIIEDEKIRIESEMKRLEKNTEENKKAEEKRKNEEKEEQNRLQVMIEEKMRIEAEGKKKIEEEIRIIQQTMEENKKIEEETKIIQKTMEENKRIEEREKEELELKRLQTIEEEKKRTEAVEKERKREEEAKRLEKIAEENKISEEKRKNEEIEEQKRLKMLIEEKKRIDEENKKKIEEEAKRLQMIIEKNKIIEENNRKEEERKRQLIAEARKKAEEVEKEEQKRLQLLIDEKRKIEEKALEEKQKSFQISEEKKKTEIRELEKQKIEEKKIRIALEDQKKADEKAKKNAMNNEQKKLENPILKATSNLSSLIPQSEILSQKEAKSTFPIKQVTENSLSQVLPKKKVQLLEKPLISEDLIEVSNSSKSPTKSILKNSVLSSKEEIFIKKKHSDTLNSIAKPFEVPGKNYDLSELKTREKPEFFQSQIRPNLPLNSLESEVFESQIEKKNNLTLNPLKQKKQAFVDPALLQRHVNAENEIFIQAPSSLPPLIEESMIIEEFGETLAERKARLRNQRDFIVNQKKMERKKAIDRYLAEGGPDLLKKNQEKLSPTELEKRRNIVSKLKSFKET